MNVKQKDKLMAAATKLLLAAGFKAAIDRRYQYYKPDSRGGEVGVTIYADGPAKCVRRRGWDIWIAGRYSNIAKAKAAGINCGRFSGKDNYLELATLQDIEYAINQYR